MLKFSQSFMTASILCATAFGAIGVMGAFDAQAQSQTQSQTDDTRYGSWQPTGSSATTSNSQNAQIKALLKDLNALIQKAGQDRAANPIFLRDLEDLAARYEAALSPWAVRQLFDDFADGDYIRNPQWSVVSGEYWVERGYGLRSKVTTASTAQAAPRKVSKEELAFSILGAVLGNKVQKSGGTQTTTTSQQNRPSTLKTRADISNAFALTMDMTSWNSKGKFEVALTQGASGVGYRLSYQPGAAGAKGRMEILKVTNRGQGVIDSSTVPSLEDRRTHTVQWTRRADGTMAVLLDGNSVLGTRDQSFRDNFTGLQFTSAGTDVIVKSVQIMGGR